MRVIGATRTPSHTRQAGWDPPRESQRTTTPAPPADGPPDIPKHPNDAYDQMLQVGRECLRIGTKKFGGLDGFWSMVTGLEAPPPRVRKPDVLKPHMLLAALMGLRNMGDANLQHAPEGHPEDPATWTHEQYLAFCVENELDHAHEPRGAHARR